MLTARARAVAHLGEQRRIAACTAEQQERRQIAGVLKALLRKWYVPARQCLVADRAPAHLCAGRRRCPGDIERHIKSAQLHSQVKSVISVDCDAKSKLKHALSLEEFCDTAALRRWYGR